MSKDVENNCLVV